MRRFEPEQTPVENYGYDEDGVPNELTGELLWPDEVTPELLECPDGSEYSEGCC